MMNDKDKQIINSYKNGKTPESVLNNISKDGKIKIKDGTIPLNEGASITHYEKNNNEKNINNEKEK